MEAAFRYRLATRLVRWLRAQGRPLPLRALGEALGLKGPVEPILRPLLDGRFFLEEEVGLWEWRYPFPYPGEAVVILDLETTGLTPGPDGVMEIGLVRLEGGRRLTFQSLVRPKRPPSPFVARLTGLTPEVLEGAPPWEAVLERAYPYLQGATWVMHHAPFDLAFLGPAWEALGYPLPPVVDSLVLARRAFRGLRRLGLDALGEVLELPPRGAHRALEDAKRTEALLREAYYMLTSGAPRPLAQLGSLR